MQKNVGLKNPDRESIEKAYSCNFHGINGQVAKPARLALGALLIQTEYGYSDLEVVDQIQESPYLQYICGYQSYIYEKTFHASLMVRFRKHFNPKVMAKINETFIRNVEEVSEDSADKRTDGNKCKRIARART